MRIERWSELLREFDEPSDRYAEGDLCAETFYWGPVPHHNVTLTTAVRFEDGSVIAVPWGGDFSVVFAGPHRRENFRAMTMWFFERDDPVLSELTIIYTNEP